MEIKVCVKLRSILKRYAEPLEQDGFEVTLPPNSTIEDLILKLEIPVHRVGMAVVGYERVEEPRILKDGDEVLLFPPMPAGGCSLG